MIRPGTIEDTEALVRMGLRFIRETGYEGKIAENPEQLRVVIRGLIEMDGSLLLVAETAGRVTGVIGVILFSHPLSAESVASELFWWVNPEARGMDGIKLLRRAEEWAVKNGASRMQMVAPTGRVGTFYTKLGYERVETMYQRMLA